MRKPEAEVRNVFSGESTEIRHEQRREAHQNRLAFNRTGQKENLKKHVRAS